MASHGVEPGDFLDFVHDIDLARVAADPALVAALDALPGRKFVFTNADEDYARRVLDRLGLANAFDGMHDIHAMDYVPKPDPRAMGDVRSHGIDPRRALFAEDMARNLKPGQGDRNDHGVGRQRLGAGARSRRSRPLSTSARRSRRRSPARPRRGAGRRERADGGWTVNQWLKKAVLLSFRLNPMEAIPIRAARRRPWWDKVPSKFAGWGEAASRRRLPRRAGRDRPPRRLSSRRARC
jgi:hypothetical protein